MFLSLSVRIAEGFLSKERSLMTLEELADLAVAAGYEGLCMRASQVGVHSSSHDVRQAADLVRRCGLKVTMVTGNFDIVYNNQCGPAALRNITPHLGLAQQFGASLIRVALKTREDIPWAQRAADQAAELGIRLVHQCHTQSLFETVAGIEQTLHAINRPNFGIVYEPANLQLCGQDYGAGTIARLAPWIWNVYLQNQIIKPDGELMLDTWCRGPVHFDLLQIHQPGGLDMDGVFDGLSRISYRGPVTVHQAAPQGGSSSESAALASGWLRQRLGIASG